MNKKLIKIADRVKSKTPNQVIEVVDRVKSETPTHFKRFRKAGFWAAGLGLAIKIGAAIFPATMPIGLASLAPELISVGLAVAGVSTTARKK
jgi:hypothetical protein